jgi:signal peptidase I
MNLLQRRNLKKQIKHIIHDARHARHMREDVAPAADLEAVRAGEEEVQRCWAAGDYAATERAAEQLITTTQIVYPPRNHPRIREYVEILVVAISVAMAFRTFFIQPFKIPTGSMQPTLYGIHTVAQAERTWLDRFPASVANFLLFGERYIEVKAVRSAQVTQLVPLPTGVIQVQPAGVAPDIPMGLHLHVARGQFVVPGQVLASGRTRSGDHIFVNKMRYNFMRPERGDVFVFSTEGVTHPEVKEDTFYIKRMSGMPGENIRIDPPYLIANEERILDPDPFRRQVYDTQLGYAGYVLAPHGGRPPLPLLGHPEASVQLGQDEYLPLGDNSRYSLDGRYFGGIRRDNIVGPAFMVYWPISPRWGWIR